MKIKLALFSLLCVSTLAHGQALGTNACNQPCTAALVASTCNGGLGMCNSCPGATTSNTGTVYNGSCQSAAQAAGPFPIYGLCSGYTLKVDATTHNLIITNGKGCPSASIPTFTLAGFCVGKKYKATNDGPELVINCE